MACEEFRDQMLDVLYGEADAAGARAWEIHQQQCAACRDELRALRRLRRDLGGWTSRRVPAAPARPRDARAPGCPLAAGIVIGIAAAFALAGSQRRVDTLAAALQAQDQRHRAEIEVLKATVGTRRPSGEATLEDVRRLIRESEARQAVVLDASLRGLAERSDAQRREDMAQVSAGLVLPRGPDRAAGRADHRAHGPRPIRPRRRSDARNESRPARGGGLLLGIGLWPPAAPRRAGGGAAYPAGGAGRPSGGGGSGGGAGQPAGGPDVRPSEPRLSPEGVRRGRRPRAARAAARASSRRRRTGSPRLRRSPAPPREPTSRT